MRKYIYPQNLKASANIWFWGMKDFVILVVALLFSIIFLVEFGWLLPSALTLCFAFLTVRVDDQTIIDFIKYAVRYFIIDDQHFEWK